MLSKAVVSSVRARAWLGFSHATPCRSLGLALAFSLGCGTANEDGRADVGAAGSAPSSGGMMGSAASGGSEPAGAPAASGSTAGGAGSGATLGGGAGSSGAAGLGGAGSAAGSSSGGLGGTGSEEQRSAGCGKTRTLRDGSHILQSGGARRSYALRAPADYDEDHPYRLMLGFHGAGGKSTDIAPSYFGLWELAQGSTIFVAPDAVGGIWKADTDTTMVGDLLEQLQDDLCIDMSRIGLEGFSQGGAMAWTLSCALPGTFRLAIVHSGGGLALPKACEPIAFLSSLGHDGSGQGMSSDFFAATNGCTVESLPVAPAGGHACTDYQDCSAGHPTRWCAYDGGHTPAPTDSGQSQSWMPEEVWRFVKQF